jgi:hypothetical protein
MLSHAAALPIEGEPANAAIQAALDKSNAVHLPKRDRPYVLDGPIILKSGQKLTADADTVIQLKPGTNTCMVRNEHIVGFADKPVPAETQIPTPTSTSKAVFGRPSARATRAVIPRSKRMCMARTASSCCKTSAA